MAVGSGQMADGSGQLAVSPNWSTPFFSPPNACQSFSAFCFNSFGRAGWLGVQVIPKNTGGAFHILFPHQQ